MHGNSPYAGPSEDADVAIEDIEALRSDVAALTARTRALLPDEFAVGSELRTSTDGPQGRVAVQPPVGNVVSAGLAVDDTEEERAAMAIELAAGAAVQVKQALDGVPPTAG